MRGHVPNAISFEARRAAVQSQRRSQHFMVLGLGLGLRIGPQDDPLPATVSSCDRPALVLKVLRLAGDDKFWPHDHNQRLWLEVTERGSAIRRIEIARRVLGAISGLYSHVHHTAYDDLALYQFPIQLLQGGNIRVEQLEQLDALTNRFHRQEEFKARLGSFVVIPFEHMAAIFYLLPFVLQDDDLFNACSFFRACCSEYSFMDGVVSSVLYEPNQAAEDERERLAFENVVLQAFRVVEAIVGEPGSNEQRFRTRLKDRGINYDDKVGFSGKRRRKLGDRIRWLHDARDSAAAHGKRRRRHPFTTFEAMEAQHIADAVLSQALWFAADSVGRRGDESEISFLLSEMFPHLDNPDWVNDQRLFNGKTAIELAQAPGGFDIIFKGTRR
jgi:hypothetical protein